MLFPPGSTAAHGPDGSDGADGPGMDLFSGGLAGYCRAWIEEESMIAGSSI